jgi:SNF2 family DNA or RNA helicase
MRKSSLSPDEYSGRETTLVVCPVALMAQWKNEIETKVKSGPQCLSVRIFSSPVNISSDSVEGVLLFLDLSNVESTPNRV